MPSNSRWKLWLRTMQSLLIPPDTLQYCIKKKPRRRLPHKMTKIDHLLQFLLPFLIRITLRAPYNNILNKFPQDIFARSAKCNRVDPLGLAQLFSVWPQLTSLFLCFKNVCASISFCCFSSSSSSSPFFPAFASHIQLFHSFGASQHA